LRPYLVGLALSGLLAGGCATTFNENDDVMTGQWTVETIELQNTSVDLATSSIVIDLRAAEASLRADTGCHQIFGSFTFRDDGTASFTVPGKSTNECAPTDEALEDQLLEALEDISSWSQVAEQSDQLVFRGPASSVTLRRQR
jgi:heat shock protein HslJ